MENTRQENLTYDRRTLRDEKMGLLMLDFDNFPLQKRVRIIGFISIFIGASIFFATGSLFIVVSKSITDISAAMLIGSCILYSYAFWWWHSLPRDGPFLKVWERGLEIPTPKDKIKKRFLPFDELKGLSFEKTTFTEKNILLVTMDEKMYLPVPYKKGCSKADLFKELNALLTKSQNSGQHSSK